MPNYDFVQLLPRNLTLGWKSWRTDSLEMLCGASFYFEGDLSLCILRQLLALKKGARAAALKDFKMNFGKMHIIREEKKKGKRSGYWLSMASSLGVFSSLSPRLTELKPGRGKSLYFFLPKRSLLTLHSSAAGGIRKLVLCLVLER